MFGRLLLSEEEKVVDSLLGYPRGYATLCRNAAVQLPGFLTPYTEGPPQRFLPYAPHPDEIEKLRELDNLFPIITDDERDIPNARKHAEVLWQQLDHMGNAGFDPAKFRVDLYGNVLYWHADQSSPLAWEIDHWFPHSRGGKTVQSNLRILQWQANQRKGNRLEFLVPWWELQSGVSTNQFLSAFASKDTNFRSRSLSFFFADGEDEQVIRQHSAHPRPWPPKFREQKKQFGLAAAAVVRVQRDCEDSVRGLNYSRTIVPNLDGSAWNGQHQRRRWTTEEEEALRLAVIKIGAGNWKEIKEYEPALGTRSTVQIKDKYRLMRGEWHLNKENRNAAAQAIDLGDTLEKQTLVSTALNKEMRVKIMRGEEKREKEEEILQLEKTLCNIKKQNETDKVELEELERALAKHRQKVEKQRRWNETQSSYRLCLERMIRDTMHQSILYKEQARLNQAACNSLMARLDCEKVTSDCAEKDLVQKYSQREAIDAILCPDRAGITSRKRVYTGRDIVDVSSCLSQQHSADEGALSDNTTENDYPSRDERGSENDENESEYIEQMRTKHRKLRNTYYTERSVPLNFGDEKKNFLQADVIEDLVQKAEQLGSSRRWGDQSGPGDVYKDERNGGENVSGERRDHGDDDEGVDDTVDGEEGDEETDEELEVETVGYEYKVRESSTPSAGVLEDVSSQSYRPTQSARQDLDVKMIGFEYRGREGSTRAPTIAEIVSSQPRHEQAAMQCSQSAMESAEHSKREQQKDVILEKKTGQFVKEYKNIEFSAELRKGCTLEESKEDGAELMADEDEVKRLGKSNLDKWLHALLHETPSAVVEDYPGYEVPEQTPTVSQELERKVDEEKPKSIFGGLLRKLSFKQQQPEQRSFKQMHEPASHSGEVKGEALDKILMSIGAMTLNSGRPSVDGRPVDTKQQPHAWELDERRKSASDRRVSFRLAERDQEPSRMEEASGSLERYVSICKEEQEFGTFNVDGQSSDHETLSTAGSESRREIVREGYLNLLAQREEQAKGGLRASIKAYSSLLRKVVKKMEGHD